MSTLYLDDVLIPSGQVGILRLHLIGIIEKDINVLIESVDNTAKAGDDFSPINLTHTFLSDPANDHQIFDIPIDAIGTNPQTINCEYLIKVSTQDIISIEKSEGVVFIRNNALYVPVFIDSYNIMIDNELVSLVRPNISLTGYIGTNFKKQVKFINLIDNSMIDMTSYRFIFVVKKYPSESAEYILGPIDCLADVDGHIHIEIDAITMSNPSVISGDYWCEFVGFINSIPEIRFQMKMKIKPRLYTTDNPIV